MQTTPLQLPEVGKIYISKILPDVQVRVTDVVAYVHLTETDNEQSLIVTCSNMSDLSGTTEFEFVGEEWDEHEFMIAPEAAA